VFRILEIVVNFIQITYTFYVDLIVTYLLHATESFLRR